MDCGTAAGICAPPPNSTADDCLETRLVICALYCAGIAALAWRPVTSPAPMVLISSAPMTAVPSVEPSCRKVLFTPDASPACCTETAESVRLLICASTMPSPVPWMTRPRIRSAGVLFTFRVCRRSAYEITFSSSPNWMSCFAGIRCVRNAAAGAAKNAAIEDGTSASPVWNASAPRTACRNTGIEKISPACPMAITPVVSAPDMNWRFENSSSETSGVRPARST